MVPVHVPDPDHAPLFFAITVYGQRPAVLGLV